MQDSPGKRVAQVKCGLKRAIPDQDWFEFRRQLGYTLEKPGDCLFAVLL